MTDDGPYRNGNGHDKDDDKIVSFEQKRAEIIQQMAEEEKAKKAAQKHSGTKPPPAINLPPLTKYFLGAIIAIHLMVSFALSSEWVNWTYFNLGFVPARFSGAASFEWLSLLTPLTHMFIHGSWIHIGMNAIMLAAFGTGVERWLGAKQMAQVFVISGLLGIALQFILDVNSLNPVIGASGGISGLFAAALIMLHKMQGFGQNRLLPMIGIVLVTYLLFGLVGSTDGNSVAWAAHIGGFLGGFAALKFLKII